MTFKAMKFRVESPEHSEKIQKVLFDMGYDWCFSEGYSYLDATYLFTSEDGAITNSYNRDNLYFLIADQPEYTLKETISYELVPVPTKKPEELVELNGLKYKKSELEEALKLIKPIEDK